MGGHAIPAGQHSGYWHARVLAETEAALACDDPHTAAIHVELATHCLKRAQQERTADAPASAPA